MTSPPVPLSAALRQAQDERRGGTKGGEVESFDRLTSGDLSVNRTSGLLRRQAPRNDGENGACNRGGRTIPDGKIW